MPSESSTWTGTIPTGIHIATSGYYYKDWIGPVYPPGTDPRQFLELYSSMFDWTEINATYYRQPEASHLAAMLQTAVSVNPRFFFSVKAHRSLTHQHSPDSTRSQLSHAVDIFRRGIEPLCQADALGAVLLQFPYSFHYTPHNRQALDQLLSLMQELPLAVELRGSDWNRTSVKNGLQQRGATPVLVDQPELKGLFPSGPQPAAQRQHNAEPPARLGYIRLHGRNAANWWTGSNISRYDYLYSPQELQEWAGHIKKLKQTCRTLLIAFNNHAGGKAVQNARQLQEMVFSSSDRKTAP